MNRIVDIGCPHGRTIPARGAKVKRFGFLALGFIMAGALPAAAQTIDLTKVYGDKFGCINKDGQEVVAEKMLLLKEGSLVMAYSACEIKESVKNKDGSLTLQTRCDAEGEESDATFKVAPAKKKGKFVVTDEDGNSLGEVKLCKS